MNREEWLTKLMHKLLPLFEEVEPGCTKDSANWRVSCSFPGGGTARKRIGECWSTSASEGGHCEMFISPVLGTADRVDHVLAHEMVHAAVGTKCGHRGPFAKLARGIGLAGKLTATYAGDELRARLNAITAKLPPYPHSALTLGGAPKQTTRMIKLECKGCGYVVRTTTKWILTGVPTCCCGTEFELIC